MFKKILLASLLFSAVTPAFSSIVISGTRIIFPGDQNEVNVRTINMNTNPALAQVWVDEGDAQVDVQKSKVPFILTPPVFRVEANKGQSIRMFYNGMALPQDKESLFWFNLLEIPPKATGEQQGQKLEIAFRTRIKIFYRPKALLRGSPATEVEKLEWSLVRDSSKGEGIKVRNPTPYYFSFNSVNALSGGKKTELNADMVEPQSEKTYFPQNKKSVTGITAMDFQYMNDYGGAVLIRLKLNGSQFIKEIK
ncbi:fimbrial biogenesis chaperone [Pantoea dispersa]|uniref:fimbrial biogenesis chaperone n=1 Tax=Pantoea dispersa TaxID=59814 RepID=UPI002DBE0A83|nr:fimbria/pilus periplasmic chaperone [Pantoea dispersa]MEB5973386.1 fimbria/pilus periplasmic chaperone [Pantoea dispersa]